MIVLYNFLNDHGESVREIYDLTETIKGLGNLEILPRKCLSNDFKIFDKTKPNVMELPILGPKVTEHLVYHQEIYLVLDSINCW